MSRKEMLRKKGLSDQENPFDRMGALELSANDFQMNLAAETISKEKIRGEAAAILKNKEIAKRVRKTMIESGAKPPELLPAAEPIKAVRKRLNPNPPRRKITGPNES
jgi:DNA-damage-inducible protein D